MPAAAGPWREHRIIVLVHHSQRLQRKLDRPVSVYHHRTTVRTLHHWRWRLDRLTAAWVPWTHSWLVEALCVHHFEGSWTDPNAPYYGGMQMDASFASTYGAAWWRHEGTPDHWVPHAQLVAAWHGWRLRGWYPWPNTARACGLI